MKFTVSNVRVNEFKNTIVGFMGQVKTTIDYDCGEKQTNIFVPESIISILSKEQLTILERIK